MGKIELDALLSLSSWCLVVVVWLFIAVSMGCLQFVIVVFPDHNRLLFLVINLKILLSAIKEWNTAWIACNSLHALLLTQCRFMVFSLTARWWVNPQTQ